jgi:L-fuconolactonase
VLCGFFFPEGGQYFDEINFVEASAQRDPRIRGIVPMAPLEWGDRVEPMLDEMHRKHPLVKGIRRILEYEEDPRAFALADDFIRGVNLLEKFDYHFSINANYSQMNIVREFVRRVPNVRMILDHCGKPGIRSGEIDQYKNDVTDLAKHPNLWIKLSDLPVEADHNTWTSEQLRPYIDATIEAFGFERTIYGGDWPICLQATSLERWIEVLDTAFSGVPEADLRKFYRDNANSFYRLGL